ncbi:MAG: hypothetical protein CL843_01120 [Crocinitomicaceae bacterium]|nr:hypothetical protein [Crocinitomicaceae bacterium]
MAKNVARSLSYLLKIQKQHLNDLREMVSWPELLVAFNQDEIWLTGFTQEQINASEVKTIPYKEVYRAKEQLLYPLNSSLPERTFPNGLKWKSIKEQIPVRIDQFNHNYFGIDSEINVQLKRNVSTTLPSFLLVDLTELETYINTASSIRLQPLQWLVINQTQALIQGNPLLPLYGDLFWQREDMVFPLGCDLELPIIQEILTQKLTKEQGQYIFWNKNGTYFLIAKTSFRPLSISSFRKTRRNS